MAFNVPYIFDTGKHILASESNANFSYIVDVLNGSIISLNSPAFIGTPTSTTATINDSTSRIATTQFVINQAATTVPSNNAASVGVIGTSLTFARADHQHPNYAVTQATGTIDNTIASTAFVYNTLLNAPVGPVLSVNTKQGIITLAAPDINATASGTGGATRTVASKLYDLTSTTDYSTLAQARTATNQKPLLNPTTGKIFFQQPANPTFDEAANVLGRTLAFDNNGTTVIIPANQQYNYISVRNAGNNNVHTIGNGAFVSGYSYYLESSSASDANSNCYGAIGEVVNSGPGTTKALYGRAIQNSSTAGVAIAQVSSVNTYAGAGPVYVQEVSIDSHTHGGTAQAFTWYQSASAGNLGNSVYGILSDASVNITGAFIQYASVGTGNFITQQNAAQTATVFSIDNSGNVLAGNVTATSLSLGQQQNLTFNTDIRTWQLQALNVSNGDRFRLTAGGDGEAFSVGNDLSLKVTAYVTAPKLGANVANPTYNLDVSGSAHFTGTLGFYNTTPITQPNTAGTTSGFTQVETNITTTNAGSIVAYNSTFTGGVGTTAYTIGDIIKALKTLGLMQN